MKPATSQLPGTSVDLRYPDSNGRFMGDTDFHNLALINVREMIEDHVASLPDVYVASNLLMYYKEGDPSSRKDPDILVAKKVGKHRRRSYRFWEEKVVPCVLFEVASRRSWRTDLDEKRWLYAGLGVKEYFVFDPEEKYVKPTLQGFRLVKGNSVPMKMNAQGFLPCKELRLLFFQEGENLRMIDQATNKVLLTRSERADQMTERADNLAEEVAILRARLAAQSNSKN